MALKYVVTKQVFGFDKTKTEKYVARQVTSEQVSFSKLCMQVGQICGAHRGTVQLVIAGLVDALVNNLDDGKSVQLGEFGIFRPGIRAKDRTQRMEQQQVAFIAEKSTSFLGQH